MNKITKFIAFCGAVIFFILVLGFIGIKISINPFPPPGCNKQPRMLLGGCFAKYAIPIQISYSSQKCLNIGITTCNGPQVDIENLCNERVTFEGNSYGTDNNYIYINKFNSSGLSQFSGNVGGNTFWNVAFITSPLCK